MPKAFTTSEESPICVSGSFIDVSRNQADRGRERAVSIMTVTLYRRSRLVTVQDSTPLFGEHSLRRHSCQHAFSTSVRGGRPQERGGSNPPFRTNNLRQFRQPARQACCQTG